MKKFNLLWIFLWSSLTLAANIVPKIAGYKLPSFAIIYSTEAEAEEGLDAANDLKTKISEQTSCKLNVFPTSDKYKGHAIVLTHTDQISTFDYQINISKGKVYIDAGGCWALEKAISLFVDHLKTGSISKNFSMKGTVEGEYLFPLAEGANLRILDDNIWDYSEETIPDSWQQLDVDPRDDARAPLFTQLIRAYMPDILTFQEYSKHMHNRLYNKLQKYHFTICYESGKDWNNTPIFYRSDNIELIKSKYHLYTPACWSNNGSKSFTSAVFKHKQTGQIFCVINTHLWWKSEAAQAGSNQARAAQVRLIMAEAEGIKAAYHCPIFVTGDMNCEEKTVAIQQFIDGGYTPCYRAATIYGDQQVGHHICYPKEGFSRESKRKGPNRETGAIDHCFIYNAGVHAEIKVFDCITPYFTVSLTDHYPNLIDATLK